MLVLSRKKRQSVVVECPEGFERQIRVTVLAVRGGKVTLGFDVDDDGSADGSDGHDDQDGHAHQPVGRPHRAAAQISLTV